MNRAETKAPIKHLVTTDRRGREISRTVQEGIAVANKLSRMPSLQSGKLSEGAIQAVEHRWVSKEIKKLKRKGPLAAALRKWGFSGELFGGLRPDLRPDDFPWIDPDEFERLSLDDQKAKIRGLLDQRIKILLEANKSIGAEQWDRIWEARDAVVPSAGIPSCLTQVSALAAEIDRAPAIPPRQRLEILEAVKKAERALGNCQKALAEKKIVDAELDWNVFRRALDELDQTMMEVQHERRGLFSRLSEPSPKLKSAWTDNFQIKETYPDKWREWLIYWSKPFKDYDAELFNEKRHELIEWVKKKREIKRLKMRDIDEGLLFPHRNRQARDRIAHHEDDKYWNIPLPSPTFIRENIPEKR